MKCRIFLQSCWKPAKNFIITLLFEIIILIIEIIYKLWQIAFVFFFIPRGIDVLVDNIFLKKYMISTKKVFEQFVGIRYNEK